MPRITITNTEANIKIPLQNYSQAYKVTSATSSIAAEIDITDYVTGFSLTCPSLRLGMGYGSIFFANIEGDRTSYFSRGMFLRVYFDHTTSNPTNQIFLGRLAAIFHNLDPNKGFSVEIPVQEAPGLNEKHSISFDGTPANSALLQVLALCDSEAYTGTNIAPKMTYSVYGDYSDQPLISIIIDLLNQGDYDGYIGFDRDIHTFALNGELNTAEYITYGDNMLPFSGVGYDYRDMRNRIKVVGQGETGKIFRTAVGSTTDWNRDDVLNEGVLTDISILAGRANAELINKNVAKVNGIITAFNGLPTLRPGQSIPINCPYAGLARSYTIPQFTHVLGSFITTSCHIEKYKQTQFDFSIKESKRLQKLASSQDTLGFSDTILYLKFDGTDNQISSFGNTELAGDGFLKLTAGSTSATLTTVSVPLEYTTNKIEVTAKTNGQFGDSYIKVTADGINFTTILPSQFEAEISVSLGSTISAQVVMVSTTANPDPRIDAVEIRTKR